MLELYVSEHIIEKRRVNLLEFEIKFITCSVIINMDMRIKIQTTTNTSIVPFDYQQKIVGTIHKWLGNNEIHDKISLYSFSWLFGGKMLQNQGFTFPNGASFFVSFYEEEYLRILIKTILSEPDMFCGLTVKDITIVDQPAFTEGAQCFRLGSPIFIKRAQEGSRNYKFFLYDNEESNMLMTETLKHKMQEAGLPEDETLKVEFDLSYPKKQVKMVTIHGVKSKASMCPVIIHGRPQSKLFAWTVGLGNSTGTSFGSLL